MSHYPRSSQTFDFRLFLLRHHQNSNTITSGSRCCEVKTVDFFLLSSWVFLTWVSKIVIIKSSPATHTLILSRQISLSIQALETCTTLWYLGLKVSKTNGLGNKYLAHVRHQASCFFMVHLVTYSQLLKASTCGASQITITPFEFSWKRIIVNIEGWHLY